MHRFFNNETKAPSNENTESKPKVIEISLSVAEQHKYPKHYTCFIPKDLKDQRAGGSNSYDLDDKLGSVAQNIKKKERLIYQKTIDGAIIEKEIISKDEIENVANFVAIVANTVLHID